MRNGSERIPPTRSTTTTISPMAIFILHLLRPGGQYRKVVRKGQTLTLPLPMVHVKMPLLENRRGEVREWTNRHAWKACVSATGPWVRIPPSPPYHTSCERPALLGSIVI